MSINRFPFLLLLSVLTATGATTALAQSGDSADTASAIEKGRSVAFNRTKGNCLSCHAIDGGELPGNSGPPLIGMKDRYPDKEQLRAQIYDPTVRNPNSMMPPFGKHRVLTKEELDNVVDFVYSL